LGGSGWDKPLRGSSALQRFAPTSYLESSEYVKALCATKIALCFLSKLNRDTYTRRCFEIPATGAALFSEYSPDLASLFVEGKEVEFFRCGEELVEKTEFYLGNPERLEALRLAGMRRVTSDGHDVLSRMRYMTALVRDWSFQ
jgi:spore maturation protein CgeB